MAQLVLVMCLLCILSASSAPVSQYGNGYGSGTNSMYGLYGLYNNNLYTNNNNNPYNNNNNGQTSGYGTYYFNPYSYSSYYTNPYLYNTGLNSYTGSGGWNGLIWGGK